MLVTAGLPLRRFFATLRDGSPMKCLATAGPYTTDEAAVRTADNMVRSVDELVQVGSKRAVNLAVQVGAESLDGRP